MLEKKGGAKSVRVLMIGPYEKDDDYRGISSVISCYFKRNDFGIYKVDYIATSHRGRLAMKVWRLLAGITRCFATLLFTETRIVHIHTADYLSFQRKMIFAFVSLMFRTKTILHIHGAQFKPFYSDSPRILQAAMSYVLNKVDMILVLSDHWVEYFQTITSNPKLRVIHNPVDGASFSTPFRKEPGKALKVLFMTMLTEDKGIYDLLRAIPIVLRNHPDTVFNLCGEGDIGNCKEICDRSGILANVAFPGWVSGELKIRQFQDADVFILPSYFEGLPVSLIEAMFAGLPIITTSVGGIPDIFQDGLNGYLVSPGDILGLAEKLIHLLQDKESRRSIGEYNRARAYELFDISVITKQLIRIYDEALASNGNVIAGRNQRLQSH